MAAKKQNYVVSSKGGQALVVGSLGDTMTFRSSSSGGFTTRVMSNGAFEAASGKANTAIREALKHPPKIAPYKK